jgi:diamine N-acetyltransferase
LTEGRNIRLRRWQEGDLPMLTALRNDVALQAQLLGRVRGSDEAMVRRWVEERSAGVDSLLLMIADRTRDTPLGYVQVTSLDVMDRRGELGICLLPSAQRRGLGRESLTLLMPYLRDTRGLRKLSLRVRSDNEPAIRCYLSVGFEKVGLLREHVFIDGAWHDLVLMEAFLIQGPVACGS